MTNNSRKADQNKIRIRKLSARALEMARGGMPINGDSGGTGGSDSSTTGATGGDVACACGCTCVCG